MKNFEIVRNIARWLVPAVVAALPLSCGGESDSSSRTNGGDTNEPGDTNAPNNAGMNAPNPDDETSSGSGGGGDAPSTPGGSDEPGPEPGDDDNPGPDPAPDPTPDAPDAGAGSVPVDIPPNDPACPEMAPEDGSECDSGVAPALGCNYPSDDALTSCFCSSFANPGNGETWSCLEFPTGGNPGGGGNGFPNGGNNDMCPAAEPTNESPCEGFAVCDYEDGALCACVQQQWRCGSFGPGGPGAP